MTTTTEQIKTILSTKSFDSLIGLKEDLWFDAKSKPGYDFSTAEGRIELAKDVSGFANSESGYLIVGLEATPLLAEKTEEVSKVSLLPPTEFDVLKVKGLIKDHMYPEITGLSVEFIESASTPGQGLGVICVPPQDETRKCFLMVRVIEEGQQLKQIVFGVARRIGSSTEPLTYREIYRLTQQGKSDSAQRLTRIEDKVDLLVRAASKPPSAAAPASADVDKLINKIMES